MFLSKYIKKHQFLVLFNDQVIFTIIQQVVALAKTANLSKNKAKQLPINFLHGKNYWSQQKV